MRHLTPEQLRAEIESHEPTDEQSGAIFAPELEYILKACPGSGKTWTTCRRFMWRVVNWKSQSGGLALLSFTNTAVSEFRAATAKIGRAGLDDPHFVGTFDSFLERFIIGPFGHLLTDSKKRPKVFTARRRGDLNNPKLRILVKTKEGKPMPIPAWEFQPRLEDGKLRIYGPLGFQPVLLNTKDAHSCMLSLLERGEYSHIQRGFWSCNLLAKFPSITKILSRRFPEIIVDEAQDTNQWLLQFLRHLKGAGTKVTLVGDPDQCIYEFGLASVTALADCKKEWDLNERPLNKSFRCNDAIASSVRLISGNEQFKGCGPVRNEFEGAYVIGDSTDTFSAAIAAFRKKTEDAGLKKSECVILCRARDQLAKIRGVVRYEGLKGKTKAMASASFARDNLGDFALAVKIVTSVLRDITEEAKIWDAVDDDPGSFESQQVHKSIWRFVRSSDGLPSVNIDANTWIDELRTKVDALFSEIGIKNAPNLSTQFKKTGIEAQEMELPLFDPSQVFPEFRFDTIHKAKGESIGGVLVLGSKNFFNGLVANVNSGTESEDKRLGYVAMTRAKHLLMIGLPTQHLNKNGKFWSARGFTIIN